MDDRQQQVQVGAGLQESRLNTDFIDFLKKYGTYGLYAMLAVVLSYVGWQRWTMHKKNTLDQAFADLGAAIASNNPDTLLKTAADHKGQGAVWQLATLAAAEHYLDSARRGSALPTDPTATAEPQPLTEAQSKEMLQKANTLLKDVLAAIGNDKAQIVAAQRARWNLATAALNADDAAAAKKYLDEYQAAAKNAGLTDMVAIATMRSASIDRVLTPVKLYSASELPQTIKPGDAPLSIPGMGQFELKSGTGGRQINLTMEEMEELRKSGKLVPLDGQDPNQPIGTPPPAPAPAPAQPAPAPASDTKDENEKPYVPPPSQHVP